MTRHTYASHAIEVNPDPITALALESFHNVNGIILFFVINHFYSPAQLVRYIFLPSATFWVRSCRGHRCLPPPLPPPLPPGMSLHFYRA